MLSSINGETKARNTVSRRFMISVGPNRGVTEDIPEIDCEMLWLTIPVNYFKIS